MGGLISTLEGIPVQNCVLLPAFNEKGEGVLESDALRGLLSNLDSSLSSSWHLHPTDWCSEYQFSSLVVLIEVPLWPTSEGESLAKERLPSCRLAVNNGKLRFNGIAFEEC